MRADGPAEYRREVALLLVSMDGGWIGYIVSMAIYCGLLSSGSFELAAIPLARGLVSARSWMAPVPG